MSLFSVGFLLIPYISVVFFSSVESAVLEKRPFDDLGNPVGSASLDAPIPTYDVPVPVSPVVSPPLEGAYTPLASPQTSLNVASSLPLVSPSPVAGAVSSPAPGAYSWSPPGATGAAGNAKGALVPGPAVTPPPSEPSRCPTYYGCNLFFQNVGVHYWPQKGQNTACLGGGAAEASEAGPVASAGGGSGAGKKLPQSPSGYVVFTSIEARDGCNNIGTTFKDYTWTYGPGELSSVRNSQTYSFNFADLPCPPESVSWTQGGEYKPMIAIPPWMTEMDPLWATCIPGLGQGVDPYTAFNGGNPDSWDAGGGGVKRHRRALHGHGHVHEGVIPRAADAVTTTAT